MKRKLVTVSVLLTLAVSAYAKGPKPLDPATITAPVALTEIVVIVRPDIDTDQSGQNYLMNVFPDSIEAIKQIVRDKHGIEIDASAYVDGAKAGTINVEFKKMDIGAKMVFHRYQWTKGEILSPRASIQIPFVIRDDGTMPVILTIHQDEPKNKKGRALTVELALKAVE